MQNCLLSFVRLFFTVTFSNESSIWLPHSHNDCIHLACFVQDRRKFKNSDNLKVSFASQLCTPIFFSSIVQLKNVEDFQIDVFPVLGMGAEENGQLQVPPLQGADNENYLFWLTFVFVFVDYLG